MTKQESNWYPLVSLANKQGAGASTRFEFVGSLEDALKKSQAILEDIILKIKNVKRGKAR